MEIKGNEIEFIMLDEKLIEEKLPLLEQRERRSCNSNYDGKINSFLLAIL